MNIKFPQVLLVHKYDLIDMPIFSALGFIACAYKPILHVSQKNIIHEITHGKQVESTSRIPKRVFYDSFIANHLNQALKF
jgi:hypothetical protein